VLEPLHTFVRGAVKSQRVDPYYWMKSPFYQPSWHYGFPGPFASYELADTLLQYLSANQLGIEQRRADPHYDHIWMVDSASSETWPVYSHPGWMSFWLVDALENWLRIFPDDDDVRDYIIGFANYVTWIKDGYCGLDNYEGVLSDFPERGMHSPYYRSDDTTFLTKWDSEHALCAASPRGSDHRLHSTWSNSLVLAVQTAGFRNTGFSYFLKQAEGIWGYVCGNYPLPGAVDQPAMYALIGEWEFYHNDKLTKVVPLFYEKLYHTDTIPPQPVTDLSVSRLAGNAGLVFRWNAPAGDPVTYQLKYFKDKPLSDWPDYDYTAIDTTKIPWWYAVNVSGEPVPASAGSPESFSLMTVFPTDSVFYAALCSRDSAGNLSRLSNLAQIDNTIGIEDWQPEEAALALAAFPNPFNPVICLRLRLPRKVTQVDLAVYNAAGRLVWKSAPKVKGKKTIKLIWNGKDTRGRSVGSGVYFLRLFAAGKEINRKIVMVR
jgi:hypothetical protein